MKLLSTMLIILFALPLALGRGTPCPVGGIIDPVAPNIPLTVTDVQSGKAYELATNEFGEFQLEGSTYNINCFEGKEFKIKIYTQEQIQKISGGGIFARFSFNPYDGSCPYCVGDPEPEVTTTTLEPEPVTTTTLAPEPIPPVEEPKQLPVENILMAFIAAIIGWLFGKGGGQKGMKLSISKNEKGEVFVSGASHKHAGIASFHSIYTLHSNVDIRHAKGELYPEYQLVDGKWKYIPKGG